MKTNTSRIEKTQAKTNRTTNFPVIAQPEQNFVQTQMEIATKALNALADEYVACIEILEDAPTASLEPEDAARLQMRMATIEKFFGSIGSNINRYAEV